LTTNPENTMTVEHLADGASGAAGAFLGRELAGGVWTRLIGVVAFARMSGVRHVEARLRAFGEGGGRVDLTLGTDVLGTTYEAAWYLMNAASAGGGRVLLASAEPGATFHPKVFIFADADTSLSAPDALHAATEVVAVVGSSNITAGGLFGNAEASLVWRPDLSDAIDTAAWSAFVGGIAPWLSANGSAIFATATGAELAAQSLAGRLPREVALAGTRSAAQRAAQPGHSGRRPRPRIPAPPPLVGPAPPPPAPPSPATPPGVSALIAKLSFGASRRWPQWELNSDVLNDFFGVTTSGSVVRREAVNRAGTLGPVAGTPLVIARGRNRRLEFPEPDGRPDPTPDAALLVVVDRRPAPFRYAVLLPSDPEYPAVEALNRTSPAVGQFVPSTKRVVVPYSMLTSVWPGCPL
jgi:hypothetical protein